MDINEIINYIMQNKPVITIVFATLWWLERLSRISSEKRERGLLRELADCPPEPEVESVAEKLGAVSTSIAMISASALFLVGCVWQEAPNQTYAPVMTHTPEKTQQTPLRTVTGAIKTTPSVTSPAIIEVTPDNEWQWDTIGMYTPSFMAMNIRQCSQVDDNLCPVVGEVARGETVTFYAIVVIHASGDVWLCLDPVEHEGRLLSQCGKMVAQTLDGVPYGKIEIVEPPG